jgi:hypothetical protein
MSILIRGRSEVKLGMANVMVQYEGIGLFNFGRWSRLGG